MKRTITTLFFIIAIFSYCIGQTKMKDCFLSMPDTLCPYLTVLERTEMVTKYEKTDTTGVVNKFQGNSKIEFLDEDYVKVNLTTVSDLQIKLFVNNSGDENICFVRTLRLPQVQSQVMIFDVNWNLKMTSERIVPSYSELLTRPDEMSEDDFELAVNNLFPYLYSAELSASSDILTLRPVIAFDIYADDNVREIMSKKDIRLQDMVQ